MIEPWERDWSGIGEWGDRPRITPPTIPTLMTRMRDVHPDNDVLVIDECRLSYGELERRSALLARQLLAAGIGKGCRIGVLLPNEESFPVTWTAITRIGAVAVCLPSLAKPVEIARIAAHGDIHTLFATRNYLHHDYAARLAEAFPGIAGGLPLTATPSLREIRLWCEPGEDCPAWARPVDLAEPGASAELLAAVEMSIDQSEPAGIIYTSGSTAEPKGIIHSHGSFIRNGLKLAVSFDYRSDERAFASMPFFWVGGLTTTMMCLMTVGGTILASRKSGDELLDFIERERTTAVVSWPHILRSLAENPSFPDRDWSAMRNGLFYEALPPDRRPAEKSLMSTPIGMTETNGPYAVIDPHNPSHQCGSVGKLMPGVEARLIDRDSGGVILTSVEGDRHTDSAGRIGELYLRSDVMMLGMVRREHDDVFQGGWYPTNDLVSFKDGHLHYEGRADDMIKAHGANVSPREVEAVLAAIPGVASANCIGIPDKERGTAVAAAVVPEPGVTLDVDTLKKRAAEALASYKLPRVIKILAASELPMLPSSKVDRVSLARLLSDAAE